MIGKHHENGENDSRMYFTLSHFLASLAALYPPSLIQDLHLDLEGKEFNILHNNRLEPSLVDIL